MFITFEGIDGCGKSTQAELLAERLRSATKDPVVLVRDPGNTSVAEAIRAIILSQKYTIRARTELLLFAAARAELVDTIIRPALDSGNIVIADRFADSTVAYQAFGRGVPIDDVVQVNAVATRGLVPCLTFFLSIPLVVAQERLKGKNADRIERSGEAFFQRVVGGYEFLVHREPSRVIRLDGLQPIETLHEEIWLRVCQHLVCR
ncbi:MAG: dTMP kinase [Bacteroidota bacterium]|nr:dTMP kinase [Candidatus Kapabacteria bacterium]MDW8218908.1 dTMP kinase [Bacteroidota bacterium]